MDRRRFSRLTLAALGLGATPVPVRALAEASAPDGAGGAGRAAARDRASAALPVAPPSQELRVDGARLNRRLQELAGFGATPDGGTSRVAFSDEDLAARRWLQRLLEEADLRVSVDAAGNLIGRKSGSDPTLDPLIFGSHIDTVPSGGRYDGPVGVMAALEAAAVLAEADRTTRHPMEVVVWANEEGGKTGSRAVVGEMELSELDLETASGYTIREGTRRIGGRPERLGEPLREPGSLAAYFELHVEQGFVLDRAEVDVGVVQGIVGIRRWTVTVDGFANHAGTTPMDQRTDALVSAAQMIREVNRIARTTPGRQVATVGRIRAEPGAPNVIPGRAVFSLEIRDLEMEKIDQIFETVREAAEGIAEADGTSVSFEPFYLSRAAPTDPGLRDVIEREARELGLSTLRMPSGAGHDAQSVALLGPVGMIFVPSRDGISHSPLEYTAPDDVTAGANVLLRTLLAVDEAGV